MLVQVNDILREREASIERQRRLAAQTATIRRKIRYTGVEGLVQYEEAI